MVDIHITNVDDIPRKRYGIEFKEKETISIPNETIVAYSLMEISKALQIIANNDNKRLSIEDWNRHYQVWEGNREKSEKYSLNYKDPKVVITKSWFVVKIQDYINKKRDTRKLRRILKEAKPNGS